MLLAENVESGHAWAQYFLAHDHLKGSSGENGNKQQRTKLSFELLHQSAINGYALATYALARLYCEGLNGIEKSTSTKLGEILLDLAAQQGHGFAATDLAMLLQERGEYSKWLEYAKTASGLGCSFSSNWLAGVHSGTWDDAPDFGVEEDRDIAFEYMKRAADQGDAECQYGTALEYDEIGDKGKAVEYLQLSADQGYAEAQCTLGSKYVCSGEGEFWMFSSENWTAGVQLLRRARDGGIDEAAEILKVIESAIKENCFNCGAEVVVDGTGVKKFNTCAKCKTVCYCSKECQIEAWKAGHKDVCVKYDG